MKKAIGFHADSVQPILDGAILSTMRGPWSKPAQKGDVLRMREGPRFGDASKAGPFAEHVVTIAREAQVHEASFTIGLLVLLPPEEITLAKLEGFPSVESMRDFFRKQYQIPWTGQWIYWGPGDPFA